MNGIRPMEMQVLIPRTTDVGKMQQIANQQPAVDQQIVSEQFKTVTNHRQQQVQQSDKSEGGKITREQEREQEKGHSQKQFSKSDSPQEENAMSLPKAVIPSDPVRGHTIDIKT
ncbi:MAG: hypothetical protein E6713_17105 [Sporomusaceae bacterium]|nr:hypothetical protein [Sporomusaceae bacterium]